MDPIAAEAGPSSAYPGTPYNVSYQYQPLDRSIKSIRLLQIQPGKPNDPIHCVVQHFDLASQPIYVALSYMWDHGTEQVSIVCGGKGVQVGHNLHRFLRQFRKVCGDVGAWLWIDALCINQSDVGERNHQVAQMKNIYQGAALVIAWLGEATDDDVLAFRALRDDRQSLDQWPWEAWYQLFRKPYWKRVWIIQEFILGQETHLWCDDLRANCADFKCVGERLHGVHNVRGTLGWKLLTLRETWQNGDWEERNIHLSLRKLSTSFAMSNSTVPLDFIYGFLGVATDIHHSAHHIVPDYAKSPARVLIDFIRNQFVWASTTTPNFDSPSDHIYVSSRPDSGQFYGIDAMKTHANKMDAINNKRDRDIVALRNRVSGGKALGYLKLREIRSPRIASPHMMNPDNNEDETDIFAPKRSVVALREQSFQDHDFIAHLRQKLGVSRAQLIMAVTKHAPDLLPRLHIMVAENYVELRRCLEISNGPHGIEKMLVAILKRETFGRKTFEELGLSRIGYGKSRLQHVCLHLMPMTEPSPSNSDEEFSDDEWWFWQQ
jgi:hypothetical protein